MSNVTTNFTGNSTVEAQEAASLMNFTVRRLEQSLKNAVCEMDEYRRTIVNLEAKIKRLEEAGDELLMWLGEDISESNGQLLQDAWNKAKEAKP